MAKLKVNGIEIGYTEKGSGPPLVFGHSLTVLVIVGEKDIATPPKHAEAIHRALPGSELFEVPGSGHLSILEKPDIVIPKIETFLSANMTGRS